jgi:hypothetical protein
MKIKLVLLLFLPWFLNSQVKTGIYSISFTISQKLLQEYSIKSIPNQNGSTITNFNYNSVPNLAAFLNDSVPRAIERFVGEVLGSEASCIFKLNKKGEAISSGFGRNIRGLPRNCLRNAIKFYEEDSYAKVYVRFYGNSVSSLSLFSFQRGYIQPIVSIRIKAYNVERKKIYNRKIRYSNFPNLKNYQVSGFSSSTKVIKQEILSSDMIFSMLKETINAYKKKYLYQE